MSQTTAHRGPGRGLLVIATATLAIAALAVALVFLRGDRRATYPPDSPEAAYQAYLEASAERDADATWAMLSSSVQRSWPKEQYLSEFTMKGMYDDDARILIERATVTGDRATLDIAVERNSGSLFFGSSRYRETFTLRLVREAGAWRIDQRLLGPFQYW